MGATKNDKKKRHTRQRFNARQHSVGAPTPAMWPATNSSSNNTLPLIILDPQEHKQPATKRVLLQKTHFPQRSALSCRKMHSSSERCTFEQTIAVSKDTATAGKWVKNQERQCTSTSSVTLVLYYDVGAYFVCKESQKEPPVPMLLLLSTMNMLNMQILVAQSRKV